MNEDSVFNTSGKGKRIVVQYGLNEIAVWLTFPQAVGRLLSSPDLSAALGYPLDNVTVFLGDKISDFETLVGSEDAKVVLRITANSKAALKPSELCRKLIKLADCVFIGQGGSHAMMRAKNGNKFAVPRRAKRSEHRSVGQDYQTGRARDERFRILKRQEARRYGILGMIENA